MNKFVNTLVKFCLAIAAVIVTLVLLLIGMIALVPEILFGFLRVALIIAGIITAIYLLVGIVSLLFVLILIKQHCKSKRTINYRI